MSLHLNTSIGCLVLLLLSTVVPTSDSAHGQLFPGRPTPAPNTEKEEAENATQNDLNTSRLAATKVGLAAAFFFTVLFACGLPILVIHCLEKSNATERLSEGYRRPGVYDRSGVGAAGVDGPAEASYHHHHHHHHHHNALTNTGLENNAGLASSPARQGHSNPTLGQETVDLLTGQQLHAYSGRRRKPYPSGGDRMESSEGHDGQLLSAASSNNNNNNNQHQDNSARSKPANPLLHYGRTDSRGQERRKRLLKMWFSRFNCLAAGIFLSSGFMELYPDVEEAISHAVQSLNLDTKFPFSPFLTLIGFFLVLSIEQIVLTVKTRREARLQHQHQQNSVAQSHGHDHALPRATAAPSSPPNSSPGNSDEENKLSPPATAGAFSVDFLELDALDCGSPTRLLPPPSPADLTFKGQPSSVAVGGQVTASRRSSLSPGKHQHHHDRHHHHHHFSGVMDEAHSFASLLRVILLLCAMSLHSLFEGLAVGLQTTVKRSVSLFSAILLHKITIAVGIGFNLATLLGGDQSHQQHHHHHHQQQQQHHHEEQEEAGGDERPPSAPPKRRVLLQQLFGTLILAGSSPLGVLIGLVLTTVQQSAALMLTTGILQGFACGTFFYVVFCELLPEEFREGVSDRLGKLLFLVLGFLVITGYAILMPE